MTIFRSLSFVVALAGLGCRDLKVPVELDRCWPVEQCTQATDAGWGTMTWGDYASTLDVPLCAPAQTLVVTTTSATLDVGTSLVDPAQAGPELSLPEALWLAFNRPGPDTILFDATVFKVDAPATITMPQAGQLPRDLVDTCIDGRGRGVIVDWGRPDAGSVAHADAIWGVGAGSLQVGLVLLNPPYGQSVHGQVAGCRLATDGETAAVGASSYPALVSGLIGPGNVLFRGVQLSSGVMRGNYINYDPLTGAQFGDDATVQVSGSNGIIEDNVLSGLFVSLFYSGEVTIRNNWVGVTPSGVRLRTRAGGVTISSYAGPITMTTASATVGPGNVITAGVTGISGIGAGRLRITRNRIFGNQNGIEYSQASPLAAPTISAADQGVVRGTCATTGHVEVFADSGNQGEQFIGETDCATGTWSLPFIRPSLPNVTATLTDPQGHTSRFSEPLLVP